MERFAELCRARGLPLTVQRRTILEELLGRTDHPTADALYEAVLGRIPGVSRTTVYRVLETLVRVGVAGRACHLGTAVRYDPNVDHHHHLVCLSCDRVEDVPGAAVADSGLSRLAPRVRNGFQISDVSVVFRGLCRDCRMRESRGHDVPPRPKRSAPRRVRNPRTVSRSDSRSVSRSVSRRQPPQP
jgi:Fur family peroxide stress response transcriptional regulator